MENLDHGEFFDLLYEGEDDIVKLDVLEMVSSVRQTYLLLRFFFRRDFKFQSLYADLITRMTAG